MDEIRIVKLDILGCEGGGAFVIILLDTTFVESKMKAENLRAQMEAYSFSEVKDITVRIGFGTYCQGRTLNSYIKSIDDALYRAKENGRNRIEF